METVLPLKYFSENKMLIKVYNTDVELGKAAAEFVATRLNETIQQKNSANLILATGASQFTFLAALKTMNIDWSKITVFHLDEYKDMPIQHPASFRKYLKERILDDVKPGKVYLLEGDANDIEAELKRYSELLQSHPVDVACIGIGENGHIAFNDPPVADFNDPKLVKVVDLDEDCRKQQLGEGWFATIDDVPKQALSLTVTAIMNCKTVCSMVPDERKAQAVYNTLNMQISTDCPATILRNHDDNVLFLDKNSAKLII